MSDINSTLTWRLVDNTWLLFTNNNYEKNSSLAPSASSPSSSSLFYFSTRKNESKGSMVYTPEGYGIIQDFNQNMINVPVKVNNKVGEYAVNQILVDLPLNLRLVMNGISQDEKIIVPVFFTTRDLIEKIETTFSSDSSLSSKIYFKGKELLKTSDHLEKIGILPNSKLIMLNSMGKPYSVNRFTTVYQGWGYSNSIDGISFMASRDIRIMGFGVYTPDKEKNVLNGVVKFIAGNDAKGNLLATKEINISKDENDSENKIARVYFDRPVRIKASEQYSCVVEIKSGNSFYGSGGQSSVNGEQDIIFTFSDCVGSMNGTSNSSGQIPEIYYFV